MKKVFMCRFLSFLGQLGRSGENAAKQLLNTIIKDSRSVTGNNVRHIRLLFDMEQIGNISKNMVYSTVYSPIPPGMNWKVDLLKEAVESKFGPSCTVDGWSELELNDVINFICT